MNVTEERINLWAQPISETEEAKCQNAISQITDAIRERFGNSVRIILQGSHKNRTNVRAESDVDIAVIHNDYCFPDISALSEEDKKRHNQHSTDAKYKFNQFKADIHELLVKKFGASSVVRKNKCIRVSGNTYRVNADVVPAYKYIRYRALWEVEAEGVAFLMDLPNERINSFPDQHYNNGVLKNTETGRAYKAVVRILKNVRNELVDRGLLSSDAMSSFFIECLAWNVHPRYFTNRTFREDAVSVALQIWSDMRDHGKAENYAEVCNLRWLFRGRTKRTPEQAEAFMLKAWSYLNK